MDHKKKEENSRETSTSASLTMLKSLTVRITTNWKILQEIEIPDHLTCLLRNLYAGQEATVSTGYGTADWFQIGKGVYQGYILSPCLFNLASLVAQTVKCLPAMLETWVRSLGQEDSLERKWQPTPVLLPGKSHGQRSLVGCSPWGCKESDTTE